MTTRCSTTTYRGRRKRAHVQHNTTGSLN